MLYICAAIGGAYLSAYASDSYGKAAGFSYPVSFLGGFLLLFGARMAVGCTSGHGLSGRSIRGSCY